MVQTVKNDWQTPSGWQPRKPLQENILLMHQKGATYLDISEKLGCNESYVYRILRKAGLVNRRSA